jgi:hypothetical protein
VALVLNFKQALERHLENMLETEIEVTNAKVTKGSEKFLKNFFRSLFDFVENMNPARKTVSFKGGAGLNIANRSSPLTMSWRQEKAGGTNPPSDLWSGLGYNLAQTLQYLADKDEEDLLAAFGGVEKNISTGGASLFRRGVRLTKNNTPYDQKKKSFISWEDAFKVVERKNAKKLMESFGASSGKDKIKAFGNKHVFRAMFDGIAGTKTTIVALPDLKRLKKDLYDDIIAEKLQQEKILNANTGSPMDINNGALFHYLKANGGKGDAGTRYVVNHQLLERAFLQGVTSSAGFQGVSLNRYIN